MYQESVFFARTEILKFICSLFDCFCRPARYLSALLSVGGYVKYSLVVICSNWMDKKGNAMHGRKKNYNDSCLSSICARDKQLSVVSAGNFVRIIRRLFSHSVAVCLFNFKFPFRSLNSVLCCVITAPTIYHDNQLPMIGFLSSCLPVASFTSPLNRFQCVIFHS